MGPSGRLGRGLTPVCLVTITYIVLMNMGPLGRLGHGLTSVCLVTITHIVLKLSTRVLRDVWGVV